jgi:acyl-CoA thioesterase FadM
LTYTKFELVAESEFYHVDNVELFSYLHKARREWHLFCKTLDVLLLIVNANVDFKKEAFDGDKLFILTSLDRIGNTSFTLKQTMVNEKNELIVSADIVMATVTVGTNEKTPVPDKIRELLNLDSELDWNKETKVFASN